MGEEKHRCYAVALLGAVNFCSHGLRPGIISSLIGLVTMQCVNPASG